MLSTSTQNRLKYALGSGSAAQELVSALGVGLTGNVWYVDTFNGDASYDGKAWDTPFKTMAAALTAAQTCDTVVFRGDVDEEIVGSNLKFDITIIGAGSLHHPDQPTSAYDPGSSTWRSGDNTGPLLTIRGRGWKLYNIMFDCPTSYAAVRLARNSLSGTSEYDASHASIIGCDFRNGLYGIEDYDGCFNVTVKDCVFETIDATAAAAAIKANAGGGPASPRRWRILDNYFQPDSSTEGNSTHIVIGLVGSLIKGNVFGTVKSTGAYIDTTNGAVGTPGSNNMIMGNYLGGVYTTADYVPGTGDLWLGNWVTVVSTQAPNGFTILAPAA